MGWSKILSANRSGSGGNILLLALGGRQDVESGRTHQEISQHSSLAGESKDMQC
jgi:hypothetical protein